MKLIQSNTPLCALLEGEFVCYRKDYPGGKADYYFDTNLLLKFNADYGKSGPSIWNIDYPEDETVDTEDLLTMLGAFGRDPIETPNFCDYFPFGDFGEGNTWMGYTGEGEVNFGWFRRSPFDEVNGANYVGYENIQSFNFDEVTPLGVFRYHFVRK